MKLLYTFIESHNGVSINLGFNLSSNVEVNYDSSEKKIYIEHKGNNKNFYGKQISELNLIVGKNGSGKTTLLEAMSFPRKNRKNDTKYFSIYMVNESDYYIEGSDLTLVPMEISRYKFLDKNDFYILAKYDKKTKIFDEVELVNERKEIVNHSQILFFPNFIDEKQIFHTDLDEGLRFKRHLVGGKGTSFDKYKYIQEKFYDLTEFGSRESKKILIHLYASKKDLTQLLVEFDGFSNYKLYGTNNFFTPGSIMSLSYEFGISENHKRYGTKGLFIIQFLESIVSNVLGEIKQYLELSKQDFEKLDVQFPEKDFSISDNTTLEEIKEYLQKIIQSALQILKQGFFHDFDLDIIEKGIEDFVALLEKISEGNYQNNDIVFSLGGDEHQNKIIESIFQAIQTIKSGGLDVVPLTPVFPNFSSGENQMIEILSGLVSSIKLLEEQNKGDKNFKQIIILMDEPDTYLHPEWSRKFIDELISQLEEYVNFSFHVIITTNSPFMLSDILPENILKIVSSDAHSRCIEKAKYGFGSNVLDILGESFFLDDLFGSFSTKRIEKIIKEIDSLSKYDEKKIKLIENFISLVGDINIQEMLEIKLNRKKAAFSFVKTTSSNGDQLSLDSEDDIERMIEYLNSQLQDKRE